jgi:hypothetical protein
MAVGFAATATASGEDILIFGGRNHATFLGCFSCSESDDNSVWNRYSPHGWDNGYGSWSPYGVFRSRSGLYSVCNPMATDPPVLTDRKGNTYGTLSVSTTAPRSVCSTGGPEKACLAVQALCNG